MIYIIIILGVAFLVFSRLFLQLLNQPIISIKKPSFNYIFGVPGGGKSSYLAYIANKAYRKGVKIYCNIDLQGIEYQKISVDDIGKKLIADGILLIDESSIEFNNRDFKTMSKHSIRYFKKHRHYNVSVFIFSQSYEDTDITLRRLCQKYFYIRKSRFYFLTKSIVIGRIKKDIDIDKLTRQIIDGYAFVPLSKFCFNQKSIRKFFNSFDRDLPLEDFETFEIMNDIKEISL